jgi:hypothetical protein
MFLPGEAFRPLEAFVGATPFRSKPEYPPQNLEFAVDAVDLEVSTGEV